MKRFLADWFDRNLVDLVAVSGLVAGVSLAFYAAAKPSPVPEVVMTHNTQPTISTLTEEYVKQHTDDRLGTVVLHAAEVRVTLHQNRRMRELLEEMRPYLRALEANGDREAGQLADRLDDYIARNP